MDDDTRAYTDADLLELRARLHVCTPRWWPHHLGDVWSCDTCGHTWICDTADHCGGDCADHLTLGWRTCG